MIRRPPKSTRTDTLFPYTSLFRSLRVQSLRALARKVVKQIEAPRSPDPIMRRPCADCEEKRVTYGDDEPDDDADQEQLDLANPNQRGLSYQLREPRGRDRKRAGKGKGVEARVDRGGCRIIKKKKQ